MKNILFAFLVLYVSFLVNGQTYTEKKADSILNSISIKDTNYAKIAHDISFYFYKKKKNYRLGIKYGNIEINTLEQNDIKNDRAYANALYNVGKFHHRLKDYQNAIKYYSKGIKTKDFPLKKAQAYCALGKCYRITGDLYKSFDYYLKGIPLMKKYAPLKNFVSLSIVFSVLCKEIGTKESNKKGILYLKKADSILNIKPQLRTPIKLYSLNVNLANLYASKKTYNYQKAKYYYLKNLNKATIEKNELVMANSYLNLGELYLNKGNDSCLYFLKKSSKIDVEIKTITSETYRNLANYYTSKENYDLALKSINESLNISFNTKNNNIIPQLSNESLLKVLEKRNVSRALKSKVEILIHLYKETKDSNYLNEAIETVNIADNLITTTINFSTENNTLFLWRQVVSDIYTLGVRVSYLLNNNSLMFSFVEKNKAFLLTTEVNRNLKNLELPLEITSRDLTFKKNILKLESNKTNNQIKDSLFNLKEKYTFFKDSVSQLYPRYKNSKNRELLSLNQVTEQLSDNEVIISYALNSLNYGKEKTTLFGLLISKKKNISFKIKNAPQVLNLLKNYKTLISKPLTTKNELDSFNKVAYSLYELLFPSKEIREHLQNKNITIIPDTNLENVPFEALNTNKNGLNYLIETCNISYVYSISFSKFNSTIQRKNTNDFVGFAPIEFKNSKKTPLKHSKQEVLNINELINGGVFTNSNANKENFLKQSSQSKIIHLATHANSEGNPSIDFYDQKLELHELYTYKNNADLVVLSACETNLGEIKKGEGVLSLARGFFYSGANTVVSSLWNVNDSSTSFLMKKFYENLKNKQSKIDALNNAKRTYLESHSLSEKSPYYWASFVLIGDTNSTFTTNYFYYLLYSSLGILLILLFFKNKQKN